LAARHRSITPDVRMPRWRMKVNSEKAKTRKPPVTASEV
jgi:hypothetical protein